MFGLFVIDPDHDDFKQILWICPVSVFFLYCFYRNREANTFSGRKIDILWFLQEYGSVYSGLAALVFLYCFNFIVRKQVMGLIRILNRFDASQFAWGVKKLKLKVKLLIFSIVIILTFIFDSIINKALFGKLKIAASIGCVFPIYCHFCFGVLFSEVLIFTKNNFTGINLRLSGLARSHFDMRYVVSLLESHNELLDISRMENVYFGLPFLANIFHLFFIFTLVYCAIVKSFLDDSIQTSLAVLLLVNNLYWCCIFLGFWIYISGCWVQIAEEVSLYCSIFYNHSP